MKRILLTTTSLVMLAGVASAEGHSSTSISWSGAATAGVAREGAVASVASTEVAIDDAATLVLDANAANNAGANTAVAGADVAAVIVSILDAIEDEDDAIAALAPSARIATQVNVVAKAGLEAVLAVANAVNQGSDSVAVGEFASYSEVSTTVTGSVTADNGMTITAAVSVDAGTGYDFANDDGFDAAKTNGVSLDNVTVATAMGTFKLDQNAVAHLVDGDDDGAADLLYTNTFGSMSVSAAIDLNKDTDDTAAAGGLTRGNTAAGTAGDLVLADAVPADVAWSAKISMPLAGGTAFVAMDEEGGNIFGASTTLGGVGVTFSSSLEALQEELSIDRSNTIGLSYAMGATTLGASWNSVEDGDQWGISAAYSADGMSISASTDEGSDWSVSGSMALGGGASAVAGVNYTEDAYLGLSFAF